MKYSDLTDIDLKIDALRNPNCPSEIIDKIIMADGFPYEEFNIAWGSEKAEVAKNLIASHKNTKPKQLKKLFEISGVIDDKETKNKILQNPSCNKNLLIEGFRFADRLARNTENKKESASGRKTIKKLLGHPDFPSVRVGIGEGPEWEKIDIYEWFIINVNNDEFIINIAENINCPNEILEKIIHNKDYQTEPDFKAVIEAAILNDNYQPKKEQIEQLILSSDELNIKKGLLINEIKFPDNLIEFEISIQFDNKDLNENDGVESLFYDTSANDSLKIKTGGPIESIFKDFRVLKWLQGIYLDASQFSVTTNFDSNPVPGDDYIESYTRLVFKCLTYKIKNIEDGHPNFDDVLENFISTERRSWLSLIDDEKLFEWLEMASKNIVLLPDVGAPERSIDIFSLANLIEFSDGLNENSLNDWFKDYRFDEGIPQGDEYYDNSIIKQVILPNGTKQSIEIQIEGLSYEKEKLNKIDSMKDFDILIEGKVDWSKGLWNTFTLEFDDKVMFDETKITAEGELGVIKEYYYDGKPFQSKEDFRIEDGSPSVDISIFLNGDIHEINIDELQGELEKAEKDSKDIDSIKDWIKNKIAKENNIVSVKVVPESRKSIIRDVIYTNTDTDESSEAQEVYRDGYFILEMSEAEMEKIDLNNPKEFKVNDYKIIDWSLDEVTFEDSEWDADKIEELDDEGILDEESKYYITGPLEITKMSK